MSALEAAWGNHAYHEALLAGDELPDINQLREVMMRRPAWQAHAERRAEPTAVFFDMTIGGIARARATCERCPVTAQCRAQAHANNEVGTWAGTTEKERRRR